jgi:hypothetical protein
VTDGASIKAEKQLFAKLLKEVEPDLKCRPYKEANEGMPEEQKKSKKRR